MSFDLDRVSEGLDFAMRSSRLRMRPQLPLSVRELGLWLEDERQWHSAFTDQWKSLLDEISEAVDATGPELKTFLTANLEAELAEVRDCRRALGELKKRGESPDPAIRRRLERAAAQIKRETARREILVPAFDDVLEAKDHDGARDWALVLADLIRDQGLRVKDTVRTLDWKLRGDDEGKESAPQERVDAAREYLRRAAEPPSRVIWLTYLLAPIEDETPIEIGPAVTVFSGEWLSARLKDGELDELPAELADPIGSDHVDALTRSSSNEKSGKPRALVRVEVGQAERAEADAIARETAELLVSLATLEGADPSIWVLTEDWVSFVDGRTGGGSYNAPPLWEASFEQDSAIRGDLTAAHLREWAPRVGAHLPLRDPELRTAASLVRWLRNARQTWEPGRLVLSDRIVEQVTGWAGISSRRRFMEEHMRLRWSLDRVRSEVAQCWIRVLDARSDFFGTAAISDQHWNEIEQLVASEADPEMISLKAFLANLEFIQERLEAPASPAVEYLERLRQSTATGARTMAWLRQEQENFDSLERRGRRIRNSLVHGGPVVDAAAKEVLPFVERVAELALSDGMRGYLGSSDVLDHLLDQRARDLKCVADLRSGRPVAESLFWS